jgi:hypothetical protein
MKATLKQFFICLTCWHTKMKVMLKRFFTRLVCWHKGCSGMTGTYVECINCPVYDTNNTYCDIPE